MAPVSPTDRLDLTSHAGLPPTRLDSQHDLSRLPTTDFGQWSQGEGCMLLDRTLAPRATEPTPKHVTCEYCTEYYTYRALQ